MKSIILGCLFLAVTAGLIYFLMAANVITLPDLDAEEAPAAIVYAAGGFYLFGGLLVLLKKRWLWIIGLAANTLVIAIFFLAYNQRPEIIFSLPGLATKIAQVILEAGLIYLIAVYRRNTQVTSYANIS